MTNQRHPEGQLLASLLSKMTSNAGITDNKSGVTFPSGFDPLDHELDGGFRPGQLVIIGGPPGVGKTVFAMQTARSCAMAGHDVVFTCYEHDVAQLFGRLLGSEIGTLGKVTDVSERDLLRSVVGEAMSGSVNYQSTQARHPRVRAAVARLESYSDRLLFVAANRATDLDSIDALAAELAPDSGLLILDYLQKIPITGVHFADRVAVITDALKDMALRHHISIVALSSAHANSLRDRRVRLSSLEGAGSIAYEADIALVLNEKRDIVSQVHVNHDPIRLKAFSDWVIVTLEKNRRGRAPIDFEFRKALEFFRFETSGRYVSEKLVDDIVYHN